MTSRCEIIWLSEWHLISGCKANGGKSSEKVNWSDKREWYDDGERFDQTGSDLTMERSSDQWVFFTNGVFPNANQNPNTTKNFGNYF